VEALERWWIKKYSLPSNHELFTSRTQFDLLVEYHMDFFEKNPLEAHRQEDGEIQFKDTGDDLIDKWEQDLADGALPDLYEAFSPESLEKLQQLTDKAKSQKIYTANNFGDVAKQNALLERIEQTARKQGLFNPSDMR